MHANFSCNQNHNFLSQYLEIIELFLIEMFDSYLRFIFIYIQYDTSRSSKTWGHHKLIHHKLKYIIIHCIKSWAFIRLM